MVGRDLKLNNIITVNLPLDMDNIVDREVYTILLKCKSSIALKEYILDSVLYYSRSPGAAQSMRIELALNDFLSKLQVKLDKMSELSRVSDVAAVDNSAVKPDSAVGGSFKSKMLAMRSQMRVVKSEIGNEVVQN